MEFRLKKRDVYRLSAFLMIYLLITTGISPSAFAQPGPEGGEVEQIGELPDNVDDINAILADDSRQLTPEALADAINQYGSDLNWGAITNADLGDALDEIDNLGDIPPEHQDRAIEAMNDMHGRPGFSISFDNLVY